MFYTGRGKWQLPFADQKENCHLPTAIDDGKKGNGILWQLSGEKTANFTFSLQENENLTEFHI